MCVSVYTGDTIGFPGGEEDLCKGKSEKKACAFLFIFFAFRKQVDYPA